LNGITKPMTKNCEFCGEICAILIEFDESLCCDPFYDKYICSKCPASTTFVYQGQNHIGYEYWVVKERDRDGYTIKSHRLCTKFSDPGFTLEIFEWRQGMQPRSIYKNTVDYKVTPDGAARKIKTILTFM
jgi:hypothetical protein